MGGLQKIKPLPNELTEAADKCRLYCRSHPEIIDVILFEGRYFVLTENCSGIDFLPNANVINQAYLADNIILHENLKRNGFSLLQRLSLSTKYIVTYSLEHLKVKDKVRFYYALKGRDGKSGVLVSTKTLQLGRATLLADDAHHAEIESFLSYWKCRFNTIRVLVDAP